VDSNSKTVNILQSPECLPKSHKNEIDTTLNLAIYKEELGNNVVLDYAK
jgi:hypothetical protein